MDIINAILGKIFEFLFAPFRSFNPWIAMIVVSFLTGLLMLFVFRLTSNQDGIRRSKNAIKAHLLELRLYKDSLGQQLRSQGRILRANFHYIGHALKPMFVMLIPVMLILIQLNLWFGSKSLTPGEDAILKLKLARNYNPVQTDIALDAPPGLEITAPALRIEENREIDWRLRAVTAGSYDLTFRLGPEAFSKTVLIGENRLTKISAVKPGPDFWARLFNPGEKPFPKTSPIESVEILYPENRLPLLAWRIHWLVAFFILSIVFGFAFKGVFHVEI